MTFAIVDLFELLIRYGAGPRGEPGKVPRQAGSSGMPPCEGLLSVSVRFSVLDTSNLTLDGSGAR